MILAVACITAVDVLMRLFLNKSIGGVDELSGFAVAMSMVWGLSYCLLHRAHVRIDSAYIHAPVWLRAICDLLGLGLFIAFTAFLARFSWYKLVEAYANDSHTVSQLSIPLKYPLSVWVSGLVFFVFCGLVLFSSALIALLRGDAYAAHRLIGSKTITEELNEETRAAKAAGEGVV